LGALVQMTMILRGILGHFGMNDVFCRIAK